MDVLSLSDETLWNGLDDRIQATLGSVGIAKMLQARDDDEARSIWANRVRPMLRKLVTTLPLSYEGAARFSVGNEVDVQLDIHEAWIIAHGTPRVRCMIVVDPASAAVGVVGEQRWGTRWSHELAKRGTARRVVPTDGPWWNAETFPWVAQKPGTPGPWTSAASEHEARLAGLAEDLGFDRVSSLFREFVEGSRV